MYTVLWHAPWEIQDKIKCDSSLNILIARNGEGDTEWWWEQGKENSELMLGVMVDYFMEMCV